MGELVNLRRVKKARARAEENNRAAQNRALFGRTKADKAADATEQAERDRADRALDQGKLTEN